MSIYKHSSCEVDQAEGELIWFYRSSHTFPHLSTGITCMFPYYKFKQSYIMMLIYNYIMALNSMPDRIHNISHTQSLYGKPSKVYISLCTGTGNTLRHTLTLHVILFRFQVL